MDAASIGELYKKFGPLIYRRCMRLLSDPELSGDACQEVFARAMRHAERLVQDRECLPWLYRVSTNYCLNLLREMDKAETVPLHPHLHRADERSMEQTAFAQEEVRHLLRRFSEADAQIAVHAFLDRMTQEEISEVMGLSRKTVGKRLRRISEEAEQHRRTYMEGYA